MQFTEIRETRPIALVTSIPAWNAVCDQLSLPVAWQTVIREATLQHWQAILRSYPKKDAFGQPRVVYAVGGGLATDAGKYIASQLQLPLICLPTALSVDAFFTWTSGIRRKGCVEYIETKPAETVIIDFSVIRAAPEPLRTSGICDVLSIATGSWDWKFAEDQRMNPPDQTYIPYVAHTAQAILEGAIECAEAAGRGDTEGLKQLLDCLILQAQLCNQIGHARPEEGSEHYFAYAVESLVGSGWPHGDLVGPGILIMAEKQGQNTQPLRHALQACHVNLDHIPPNVIRQTLSILPAYVRRHRLPFGIAHTLEKEKKP